MSTSWNTPLEAYHQYTVHLQAGRCTRDTCHDTSHVALHGALSAGGLGAAGAEHLGVDPV